MKKVLFITVPIIAVLIAVVTVLLIMPSEKSNNEQPDAPSEPNVTFVQESKPDFIQNDDVIQTEIVITTPIEDYFDYYLCTYLRSALYQYAVDTGVNPSFRVLSRLDLIDGSNTFVRAYAISEDGIYVAIDMDRDTDTGVAYTIDSIPEENAPSNRSDAYTSALQQLLLETDTTFVELVCEMDTTDDGSYEYVVLLSDNQYYAIKVYDDFTTKTECYGDSF